MTEENDDFDKLLQDFIASELKDIPEEENKPAPVQASISPTFLSKYNLALEEKSLFLAWQNFCNSATKMAELYEKTPPPIFIVTEKDLYPRYSPYIAYKFTEDSLSGWEVMLATYPNQMSTVHANASDEQLLDLAEKTSDATLQMAIISYVEILIELESCDIAYQVRKSKAKQKLIQKKIYEEHQQRAEKIKLYIQKIKSKKFPIDAERLILNYFKTAKKDPKGAWEVVTTNPAVFAPIEIDKIPDRLFGLIKSTPKDGFRWNRIIGDFIRRLKV